MKPRHSPADWEPFPSGGARRIFSRKSVASLYRRPGALWKCSSEMRNEPCFTFPRVSPFRVFHLSARLRSRRASYHLIMGTVLIYPRVSYLSPAQDSDTHAHSVEFFCHSRARVWRARGIPNSAGGRGEGPGFFARQPRARMTKQEIEQDRNCHYDLQSSISSA